MEGAQGQGGWTGASSTAISVVSSAGVFHLGLMGTRMSALVTGTREIPRANPSALDEFPLKQENKNPLGCLFFVHVLKKCQFRVSNVTPLRDSDELSLNQCLKPMMMYRSMERTSQIIFMHPSRLTMMITLLKSYYEILGNLTHNNSIVIQDWIGS